MITFLCLAQVSAVGLGCAGLAGLFRADDVLPGDNAIHLIHHAFKMGVTLFDTADWYGPHTNEILLGKVEPDSAIIYSFSFDPY